MPWRRIKWGRGKGAAKAFKIEWLMKASQRRSRSIQMWPRETTR
jgi:hypothetical protein